MADLLLGPHGGLPPEGALRGALLWACVRDLEPWDNTYGTRFRLPPDTPTGGLGQVFHGYADGYLSQSATNGVQCIAWRTSGPLPVAAVCLDLTTGLLDHAARALLYALAPTVDQPLTAPGWRSFYRRGEGRCWELYINRQRWVFGRDSLGGVELPDNGRQALVQALHTAWADRENP